MGIHRSRCGDQDLEDIWKVRGLNIKFDVKHIEPKKQQTWLVFVCDGRKWVSRLVGEGRSRLGWWCNGHDQRCNGKAREDGGTRGLATCSCLSLPSEDWHDSEAGSEWKGNFCRRKEGKSKLQTEWSAFSKNYRCWDVPRELEIWKSPSLAEALSWWEWSFTAHVGGRDCWRVEAANAETLLWYSKCSGCSQNQLGHKLCNSQGSHGVRANQETSDVED